MKNNHDYSWNALKSQDTDKIKIVYQGLLLWQFCHELTHEEYEIKRQCEAFILNDTYNVIRVDFCTKTRIKAV